MLNYGLFQPAFNGRAGKFLDEERLLRDYPLNPDTPVPYLEVPIFMHAFIAVVCSTHFCLSVGLDRLGSRVRQCSPCKILSVDIDRQQISE